MMGGGREGFPKLPGAFAGGVRTDPLPFLLISLAVLSVHPTRDKIFGRCMRA